MRTDVIDRILAMAVHPAYDCQTARVSASMIQCLTQSPEAHVYIARKEVVEDMLKICEQKQKLFSDQQASRYWLERKEDPLVVMAQK